MQFPNTPEEWGAANGYNIDRQPSEAMVAQMQARAEQMIREARGKARPPTGMLEKMMSEPYWDGNGVNGTGLWLEAAILCKEFVESGGENVEMLRRAARLYALGLLIHWDIRMRMPLSFLFQADVMRKFLLQPPTGDHINLQGSDPNAYAAYIITTLQPVKSLSRLQKLVEAHPNNGVFSILCGRIASEYSEGFAMGMPVMGSQEMCEYYCKMFRTGAKLLENDKTSGLGHPILALLWERGYTQTLTAEFSAADLAESKKSLDLYDAKAPKDHEFRMVFPSTKERLQMQAKLLKEGYVPPTKSPSKSFQSVSDARKCVVCAVIKKDLKVCSGCGVVRYCGADCQKKHWPSHKADCKRWATAKNRSGPESDQQLYKVQVPLTPGDGSPLMVYNKNRKSFLPNNLLPASHPQYAELAKEVRTRGSLGSRGYFYGKRSKEHGMWFDTVLVSPKEDW